LYAYTRNSPHELTFNQGEYVFIVKEEEGWLEAEINGQKGFVPANYVEVISKINKNVAAAQEPKKTPNNNNNSAASGGAASLAAAAASAASAISKQPQDRKRPERKEAGEDSGMSKKQLIQELDDLKKLIFRQQSTRSKLESIISQLTVQLREIQSAINENNFSSSVGGGGDAAGGVSAAQLSNLRNEHKRMKAEVDRLRGMNSTMQSQITEANNALLRAQRELQDLTDEKQTLQSDITTLTEKIESMKEAAPNTPGGSRREPPSRRVIPVRQAPP
jgi:DNA repair exonuclease SbcCD ATPase subunit